MMDSVYHNMGSSGAFGTNPEKLLNFNEAAHVIGVKVWQIRRAAKAGAIPTYSPFNSRRLVKLSEVVQYIDSCRQGGVE